MNLILGTRSDGWGRIRIVLIVIPTVIGLLISAGFVVREEMILRGTDAQAHASCMSNFVGTSTPAWERRLRCERLHGASPQEALIDRNLAIVSFASIAATGATFWLIAGLLGWIYRGFAEKPEKER